MKKIAILILEFISSMVNKLLIKISSNKGVSIIETSYDDKGRFLVYHLNNNNLESHKKVLKSIFNILMSDDKFKAFGNKKVIIIAGINDGNEFGFHHNVLITNNNTFSEYYNSVKHGIATLYENDYPVDVIPQFKVRVWNMDNYMNKKIKITKVAKGNSYKIKTSVTPLTTTRSYSSFIKPIKQHNIETTLSSIATMDIETMEVKGYQFPVCISLCYLELEVVKTKLFLIRPSIFKSDPNRSVDILWERFFDFITNKPDLFKNIFVHNLGSFDGVFLYKALSAQYSNTSDVSTIIDNKNKFIKITLNKYDISWKDSHRLFSVSLNDLCKVFNVKGKISKYEPRFNNLDLFDNSDLLNEFKAYSLQDSLSLHSALIKAQEIYFRDYSVDIANSLSSSSLSLKIFRTSFLKHDIPILKSSEDSFIRRGYFGGHTDHFKAYAKKLYYYDVNSLYPYVMSEFPMPVGNITYFEAPHGNILDFVSNPFGFFECEITSPTNLNRPLLQTKVKTKSGMRTVAPLGTWKDMIFSEEMFNNIKHGYSFKILRGYLFDKENIFKDYVLDLYEIKQSHSKDSPMYLISKLLMNSLYGRFGMSPYLIDNSIMDNLLIDEFFSKNNFDIIDVLDLNNGKSLISYKSSVDPLTMESNANVNISIAAAITAYARVHMTQFLSNPNFRILYTDTDSIYIEGDLDPKYIGSGLGQMKLEYRFKECVFLAPKVYGGILDNGKELVKVKGFKDPVKYLDLKSLLDKNSKLELNQSKWFKSISKGTITVKDSLYTLLATENKRQLIYENNKIIGTKPFVIDSSKNIISFTKHLTKK